VDCGTKINRSRLEYYTSKTGYTLLQQVKMTLLRYQIVCVKYRGVGGNGNQWVLLGSVGFPKKLGIGMLLKTEKGAQIESNNDKKLKQNYHNSDILISITVFFHF